MLGRFESNTRARALALALFAAVACVLWANAAPAAGAPAGQSPARFAEIRGFAHDLGGCDVQPDRALLRGRCE